MKLNENQVALFVYFFGLFERPDVGDINYAVPMSKNDAEVLCKSGLVKAIGRTYHDNYTVLRLEKKGLDLLNRIASKKVYKNHKIYCGWEAKNG